MNDCISTNADRRERVYAYVESYRQTWEPGGSYHEVVTDMITDLLHFMVWHGEPEEGDPLDVLDSARSHYEAEAAEEEDEYVSMVCDTCGTVGNKDDAIEIGGPCAWEWCDGTIRKNAPERGYDPERDDFDDPVNTPADYEGPQ